MGYQLTVEPLGRSIEVDDGQTMLDACLREGLAVAMLREPVAAIDLYLVSQRGKQPSAVAMEFAEVLKKAAMRLGA